MGRVLKYKNVEILRKELVVLKNVNFSIQEGEFVYMIGKVGSGKSSLLKSMYAEIPVSVGDATVLGFDLQSLKGKQVPLLRRAMGIVFQDFQLLTDRSVYDNLHFVLRATGWRNEAEIKERIAQTLQKVGMSNKSYKMPHELSGGEQQRVVIARALLNNPKLILADEPTGNLDINAGTQIVELLRSIAANGTAVIMATHNVQFLADYPARTLCCKDKRLFELTADDDRQEATAEPQQSEATPALEPEHSKYESYMPATPLDATPAEIAPDSVAEPMDGSHSKETKQE